jgi:hypothetical protein
MKSKVFCIGFHKTGTTSLGKAMEQFGYKNCHGAGKLRKHFGENKLMELLFRKDYEPLFEIADLYDSFNDNPWFIIYKALDLKFTGSKFILMLRDEQAWINSCKKYFGTSTSAFRLYIYGKGSPIGNEEVYLARYRKHNYDVLNYFKSRPDDLLVLNLEDEDKGAQIASFLNTENAIDYPFLNWS